MKPSKNELTGASVIAEHRATVKKKLEQKYQQTELNRKADFKLLLNRNYNYSPTIEDFREELAVQSITTDSLKFLSWLRKTKKIYANSKSYFIQWGARGIGYDRYEVDKEILNLINQEINRLIERKTIPEIKSNALSESKAKNKSKPTYLQLALYYYYMQEAFLIDRFDYWPDGIVPAYKEVCKQNQLNAQTSWRRFQREYTGIKNESNRKKLGKRHFNKLIGLLKDKPAAIQIANKELKSTQR